MAWFTSFIHLFSHNQYLLDKNKSIDFCERNKLYQTLDIGKRTSRERKKKIEKKRKVMTLYYSNLSRTIQAVKTEKKHKPFKSNKKYNS